MAAGILSKERDTWNVKYEVMEQRCFVFQKELVKLKEKVKLVDFLREETKISDSPSSRAIQVTGLEDAFEVEKKRCQDASDDVTEMTSRVEEDRKTLQRELEAHT